MNILETIGAGIVSVALFIGGILGFTPEMTPVESLGADTVSYFGGQTYTLAGSGISSSATSFTLTSFTITQNGKLIQDSDMSDTFYGTFEPGSRTRQEFFSCTTVVQNSGNTATISGCTRGLSPLAPYTASSSLQFSHGGGSSVIFSNTPQFYDQFTSKGNDETITGQWTFTTFPVTPSSSPASATTSGTVELATGDEAASSTLSGDIASSRLALHTGISTSSAPSSGNVVVVTGDDGNIDAGFLPTLVGSTSIRFITTTGSSTYTKPNGLKHIRLKLQGAGGDGGSGTSASGGGGGGCYLEKIISASLLGATTSIYVSTGSGGPGSSLFGGLATSTDGGDASTVSGGSSGTCSGGDLNIPGQAGQNGSVSGQATFAGGKGGNSVLGFGGGGGLYPGTGTDAQNGQSGSGYGGGGGGLGEANDGSPDGTAGTGSQGVAIIEEVF
jgi:hypothetical protein